MSPSPGRPSRTGAELLKRGKVVGITADVWIPDLEKSIKFEATPEEIKQIMSVLGAAAAATSQRDVVVGSLILRYEGSAPLQVDVMESTFQVYHETGSEDDYQLVNDGRIEEVLRRIVIARQKREWEARDTQPTKPQPKRQGQDLPAVDSREARAQ